jgi:hypothetical protein
MAPSRAPLGEPTDAWRKEEKRDRGSQRDAKDEEKKIRLPSQ